MLYLQAALSRASSLLRLPLHIVCLTQLGKETADMRHGRARVSRYRWASKNWVSVLFKIVAVSVILAGLWTALFVV